MIRGPMPSWIETYSATMLPHGREVGESLGLEKYWVGKIKEIRARGDEDVC
jgi:hypothetical protein